MSVTTNQSPSSSVLCQNCVTRSPEFLVKSITYGNALRQVHNSPASSLPICMPIGRPLRAQSRNDDAMTGKLHIFRRLVGHCLSAKGFDDG